MKIKSSHQNFPNKKKIVRFFYIVHVKIIYICNLFTVSLDRASKFFICRFVRGFNICLLHYLEFVLIHVSYICSYFTVTDDGAESALGSYDGGDGRASADSRYLPAWHTASSECRPFSLFLPTGVISFAAARGYFRQSRDSELDP